MQLTHTVWFTFFHFLTALAVGFMMTRVEDGRAFLPISFLIGIFLGVSAGITRFEAAFMEIGIIISVGLCGIILFSSKNISTYLAIPLLLLFGFFHGDARGLELREVSQGRMALDLMLATLLIHSFGYYSSLLIRRNGRGILRFSGAGM